MSHVLQSNGSDSVLTVATAGLFWMFSFVFMFLSLYKKVNFAFCLPRPWAVLRALVRMHFLSCTANVQCDSP